MAVGGYSPKLNTMKRANSYLRSYTFFLLSLVVLVDFLKAAPDTRVFQSGDLMIYFRNPSGSVNNDRVVGFSAGSTWNVFRRAATPTDPTFGTVISLGNIDTFLSSSTATGGYGSDWTSLSSSIWVGAVGQHGPDNTGTGTVEGDYARTVYVSKARLGAGDYGQANSDALTMLPGGAATQASISSQIGGSGGPFIGELTPQSLTDQFAATMADNNPIGDNGYTLYEGGLMAQISSTTYNYGAITGVVAALDIFRQTPVLNASGWQNINNIDGVEAREGYYLGTIVIRTNGDVLFVARKAEPAIDLTGDDLTGMTTTQGVASAPKNLTISATNLGTSALTITLPPGFQVSTNGGTSYADTGTIAPTNGAVNAMVRVRIAAVAPLGPLSGDVSVGVGSSTPVMKPISGMVRAPAPSVAIAGTLSGFVTTAGTASAAQNFSVSGSNLTGALIVTAPAGFELRRAGSGSYGSTANLSPANGTVDSTSMEIRIAAATPAGSLTGGVINVASTGATSATTSVSGTVNAAPSLTVSPASLSGFSATQGTASAVRTFTVSGENLTGNVTVTAPSGFEVSSGGGSYDGSLALTRTGSTLASTTISVRLSAEASVGSPTGNVTVSSSGASNQTVSVSGTVVPPPSVTVSGTLSVFTTTQGTASAAQTFTVSGANLTGNVTIEAPANFEVSTNGTSFAALRTLTPSSGSVASTTVHVRITATAPNGSVGGNILINSSGAPASTLPASGFVGSQPAINAVSNFSPFSATEGTPSAAQTFTVSGANLTGSATVQAPANFEVSTDGTNFFASRTLEPTGGSLAVSSVFARITATAPVGAVSGNITVSSVGAMSQTVSLSGTVVPPPAITATGTLASFSTTAGTASVAQQFSVSGANLTGDVTVAAPTGFELAIGSGSYAGVLTLGQSAGTLTNTTILVRLAPTATVGSPGGDITISSHGATGRTLTVRGTVIAPPSLSASGSLTRFITKEGEASLPQSLAVSGSNLTGDITVAVPNGFEVSSNGRNFATRVVLARSGKTVSPTPVSVRVAVSAPAGSLSGNVSVSTTGVVPTIVSVSATVTARPRLSVLGSLVRFRATAGVASSEQSLQLSGSNLTGDVTILVPGRFEISTGGGQPFASTLTISRGSGRIENQSIFVRLAAAPANTYSGDLEFRTRDVSSPTKITVTGTVVPAPTVTASARFVLFSSTAGSASAPQSFSVKGENLTERLTVTAPSGYEIAPVNGAFSPLVSINERNGAVAASLRLRLAAGTPVGSPSGTITLSSSGATEFSLAVSGEVVEPPLLTLSGTSLPELSTLFGRASGASQFTVSGTSLRGNVTVTAPAGFEVTGQRKPYAQSLTLTPSQRALSEEVSVRVSRTAKLGNLTGSIAVTSMDAARKQIAVRAKVSAQPNLSLLGPLKPFNTVKKRPSASQSLTVAGTAVNAVVSVTAPAGFQVSLDNTNFLSRVQLNPANQTLANRRIWIRLASGVNAGSLSGNVTASSVGAPTKVIRINGRIR